MLVGIVAAKAQAAVVARANQRATIALIIATVSIAIAVVSIIVSFAM